MDIEKIQETKSILQSVIDKETGIDTDDLYEYISALLQYTNEMEKQLGIEKTVNGMRLNDIHALSSELDRTRIRADLLNDKLNRTEIMQQENKKMELENDIKNKLYKLDKYNRAIETIEGIIKETLPNYYD